LHLNSLLITVKNT